MYKKALHAFFLKVHPDFFTAQPTQQRANEAAIAQLNELLGWAKEFKMGTYRTPPSMEISLTFYASQSTSTTDGNVTGTSSTSSLEHLPIEAKFELPKEFVPGDGSRGIVERATNKFLRDLLRKARCIDGAAESVSVAEDLAQEKEEVKPLRRRSRDVKKAKPAKSLLDEAADAMVASWSLTAVPTMDELMEADQILFSQTLSPIQSAAALNTIRENLGELMYERWQSMPLLISDHFAVGDISGTITVPWDFSVAQFYAFLNHQEAAIQGQRKHVETFAKRIEVLIAELCNDLEVDDVLISCAHKDALGVLELMHRNRAILALHHVQHVTLEIGNKFALRANGVVMVPHDMSHTRMMAWLEVVRDRMPRQQHIYQLAKQMLESTMWHLKEFRRIVEPSGIDAFENDCTYAQRLQWAKELFSIAGSLAQWDWSEITFSIGPVDVNWDGKMVTIPHNFDGAALVRYMEGVHAEAKQKKRDQLLKESSMAKEQLEHVAQEGRNPTNFEEELQKEFPEAAAHSSAGGDMDDASLREAATPPTGAQQTRSALAKYKLHSGASGKDDENVWGRAEKQATLRRTAPHLEEYMASSPDAVDALSVERPLAHSVTFASDAEARYQLLWEGFYDDPYVDQRPVSDVDDIQHAFMATNRWHREKAAKEMIEELQGKYGNKKRRFDHIKMGDLLGINDPKVQPKGFPILAPGVRQGQ